MSAAVQSVADPGSAVAGIGHNGAPKTAFDLIEAEILDLYQQAVDYLDGEPISTQGQADDVGNLRDLINKAQKKADALRVEENEPFDAGKAEVQARYAPLIADTKSVKGKTVLATEACKKALSPWLIKVQAEIDAAAALARKAADEKARLAQEAIRTADATNLGAREAAEKLITEAKIAGHVANKAEKATAVAGGSFGRSVGLRTVYTAEVIDETLFSGYLWLNYSADMKAFLYSYAQQLVDMGKRNMSGVKVNEEKKAV